MVIDKDTLSPEERKKCDEGDKNNAFNKCPSNAIQGSALPKWHLWAAMCPRLSIFLSVAHFKLVYWHLSFYGEKLAHGYNRAVLFFLRCCLDVERFVQFGFCCGSSKGLFSTNQSLTTWTCTLRCCGHVVVTQVGEYGLCGFKPNGGLKHYCFFPEGNRL